jgi:hypothetical protein
VRGPYSAPPFSDYPYDYTSGYNKEEITLSAISGRLVFKKRRHLPHPLCPPLQTQHQLNLCCSVWRGGGFFKGASPLLNPGGGGKILWAKPWMLEGGRVGIDITDGEVGRFNEREFEGRSPSFK